MFPVLKIEYYELK